MRVALFLFVALQASSALAGSLEHHFQEGETLWFVSQIYYGQGTQYKKIMRANQLRSPDGIEPGKTLQIPDPLFTPAQPGFDLRLNYLREKREEALARGRELRNSRSVLNNKSE